MRVTDLLKSHWKVVALFMLAGGLIGVLYTIALPQQTTEESENVVTGTAVLLADDANREVLKQLELAGKYSVNSSWIIRTDSGSGPSAAAVAEYLKGGKFNENGNVATDTKGDVLSLTVWGERKADAIDLHAELIGKLDLLYERNYRSNLTPIPIGETLLEPIIDPYLEERLVQEAARNPVRPYAEFDSLVNSLNGESWIRREGVQISSEAGTQDLSTGETQASGKLSIRLVIEEDQDPVQSMLSFVSTLQNWLATDSSDGQRIEIVPRVVISSIESELVPPIFRTNDKFWGNMIVGLLLGLMLGLVFAYSMNRRKATIRKPEDLAEIIGDLPVLIMHNSPETASSGVSAVRPVDSPDEFRSLRTSLVFGNSKSSVICLLHPVDASSSRMVALKLTESLRQVNRTVVFVDAEFEAKRLNGSSVAQRPLGLSNILASETDLHSALSTSPLNQFPMLCYGNNVSDPVDLFSGLNLRNLLTNLSSQYEYVIIASPAVLGSDAAAILATHSDATYLIVNWGVTTQRDVRGALAEFSNFHVLNITVVLVDVPIENNSQWRLLDTGSTRLSR